MIRLDLTLPLAGFALRVQAELSSGAVAVMGRSGAGKTSLLEAIAGLRPAARGRLEVNGRLLLDSEARLHVPPERRRIGYVPQDALLFPHLTVAQNVRFGASSSEDAARRALSLTETAHLASRRPASLSGGERQRVALARALATGPELLLLDEPLAALDEGLKGRILPHLLKVRDEAKVPFLYVTHQHSEARLLAREALWLEQGAVKAVGPADEVLGAAGTGDSAGGVENLIPGRFRRLAEAGPRLELAGGHLLVVPEAPELADGHPVLYALRGEELILSVHPLAGVSARNVFPGEVGELRPQGHDVRVRLSALGRAFWALVTADAVRELGLGAGARVWVAVKTQAFARVG